MQAKKRAPEIRPALRIGGEGKPMKSTKGPAAAKSADQLKDLGPTKNPRGGNRGSPVPLPIKRDNLGNL